MMKLALATVALGFVTALNAQTDTTNTIPTGPQVRSSYNDDSVANRRTIDNKQLLQELSNRSNDHFLIQYGYDGWANKTDSTPTKGFSRHFNMYIMTDKPFKTNPHMSIAFGVGIGSSNIFLDETTADVAGKTNSSRLIFKDVTGLPRYKKYKLVNVWAEIPIELRYLTKPLTPNKSWKFVIGGKIGTMINAHTKGKSLTDSAGNVLAGQDKTIEKVNNRKFFNSTRLAGTVRIGYGILSLYGAYQFNSLIKDGLGPKLNPYSIGLCLGGL